MRSSLKESGNYGAEAKQPSITGALEYPSTTEPPRRRGYLHGYHDWALDFSDSP